MWSGLGPALLENWRLPTALVVSSKQMEFRRVSVNVGHHHPIDVDVRYPARGAQLSHPGNSISCKRQPGGIAGFIRPTGTLAGSSAPSLTVLPAGATVLDALSRQIFNDP